MSLYDEAVSVKIIKAHIISDTLRLILSIRKMIQSLLNLISSLKQLLKLNESFQLIYKELIYSEILKKRNHNKDEINQLIN